LISFRTTQHLSIPRRQHLFADPGGRLCYRLGYDGTDPATMAHVHRGGPGQTGEPNVHTARYPDGAIRG